MTQCGWVEEKQNTTAGTTDIWLTREPNRDDDDTTRRVLRIRREGVCQKKNISIKRIEFSHHDNVKIMIM